MPVLPASASADATALALAAGVPQTAAPGVDRHRTQSLRTLNRQEQIYFEAARLFNAKGFAATSMNDIAAAVGMTKAGLYHFVKGKEDLLNTLLVYGMDVFQHEVVDPALATPDPRERLALMIRLHVANIGNAQQVDGNPLTIIVNETAGLAPGNLAIINMRKRAYLDLLRGTLAELRAAGQLADDIDINVAAFGIIGMVLQLPHWHRLGGRLSLDAIADTITRVALHGALQPLASDANATADPT